MQIVKLISQLQELRNTYSQEYVDVAGEPTICIDVFKKTSDESGKFSYAGFSEGIKIEKSSDGVYDIISAFAATYDEERLP